MSPQMAVEVVAIEPTPAVALPRQETGSDLSASVPRAIRRVRQAVAAARVPTSGPPFVRYLSIADPLEVEIGLPVDQPQAVPGLRTTILPGGTAATVDHHGSIDLIPLLLAQLADWVDAAAESAGRPWQWHLTDPDQEPSRTRLVWPIRR